jgi:aldehyde dehydrogenase (NAD+)
MMNYSEIIHRQHEYFNTNATKSIDFRIEQLKKLQSAIQLAEAEWYTAIYADFKKSEFDTYASELSLIYDSIRCALKHVAQWAKRKPVRTNFFNLPARSYMVPEPLGVCLVIGAWNYPYLLSLTPLIAAITAGNTVVLKPSEIPTATSHAIAQLINNNFPPEYLVVLEGGVPETTEILKLQFDKIFFTGSQAVGKIVYQAAAQWMTPVTLELGGKSPAIVTRDTNLKQAAKRITWSKFLNAGQTCLAPDYVLIDEKAKDEFLNHLQAYLLKYDYSLEKDNYVQIINERNYNRLTALIDKDKIFLGGETNPENRFIAPTILTNITFDDPIMEHEIFGPLLPVITYSDLNDVLPRLKSMPQPLSCYIFSNDKKVQDELLSELSFGGGCINDTVMQISNPNLPFGGVGESGIGSYHGEWGFTAFSHYKSILDKPFWGETPLKYPPYSKTKLKWIKRILPRT